MPPKTLGAHSAHSVHKAAKCSKHWPLCLLFKAPCYIKAWVAFVTADRANVMSWGQTVCCKQLGIRYVWNLWTLDFAVGLWERPQTVLQAHQPVTVTWREERVSKGRMLKYSWAEVYLTQLCNAENYTHQTVFCLSISARINVNLYCWYWCSEFVLCCIILNLELQYVL